LILLHRETESPDLMRNPLRMVIRLDVGWLFLLPGAAILASVVLIPAFDDLAEARWRRDQVAAALEHRAARLDNHARYLEALSSGDESVLLDLAATQLNQVPAGWIPVPTPGESPPESASVFPALEPGPIDLPTLRRPETLLRRLSTGSPERLWLASFGALCVLVGLLPPASGRGAHEGIEEGEARRESDEVESG
jgi:hypothetical protein